MRIVFAVTNDLSYDQRMHRICSALADAGYQVLLIGRLRKSSKPLEKRKYSCHRILCKYEFGKLFYLEYNFKLWKYLRFTKADVFCAIDLDTILPFYLVTRKNKKQFGYDAHEYFTEMEEVVRRPMVKKVWKWIEKLCVPKVDFAYTISNGYKSLFEKEYKINFGVIRNVANQRHSLNQIKTQTPTILYQGAVNEGRGLEELIEAMQSVDANLIVCGKGDVFDHLQELSKEFGLTNRIFFKGYLAPTELAKITPTAHIGITLFTNNGLSNQHSLANRFFDYFHAGIPQLAMKYPEYESFMQNYKVGHLIEQVTPSAIADGLKELLTNKAYYNQLAENCLKAAKAHNWQNESKKLVSIYKEVEAKL